MEAKKEKKVGAGEERKKGGMKQMMGVQTNKQKRQEKKQ